MLLNFNTGISSLKNNFAKKRNSTFGRYSNLPPLKCDTVSFGAMKKTAFNGIDLLVVNKFKAPIEKFYTNDNLQNWCKTKLDNEYLNKDYKGRQLETVEQRKHMLKEWFDYCLKENDAYNNAAALLIIDGITSELKDDNDNLPPVLNKGVLADTITQIKESKEKEVNFNKLYQINLKKSLTADLESRNGDYTGWVIIPSKKNDSMHFEENVSKLKTLSHNNWCTKSFNAEPYLSEGDFHIYMEKGEPRIGVRFIGDEIQEIQGVQNNNTIPVKYFDIVKSHIKNSGLRQNAERELQNAQNIYNKITDFKKKLGKPVNEAKTWEILNAAGIKYERDENDGLLILNEYDKPDEDFEWSDLDVNENNLFKDIKEITGYANFAYSNATNLGNLQKIGGIVMPGQFVTLEMIQDIFIKAFEKSVGKPIKDASSEELFKAANMFEKRDDDGKIILKKFDEPNKYFSWKNLGVDENKLLEEVKEIKGNANFHSGTKSLYNIKRIGGNVELNIDINDLGLLEEVDGDISFDSVKMENLGNLKRIGGNANFSFSHIESLYPLEQIGGDAAFGLSQINNLGELKEINGDADFKLSNNIKTLGKLKKIGGNANFISSGVETLGSLETIGGDIACNNFSEIKDLGNLKEIGGSAEFAFCKTLKSLGKLHSIGSNANFDFSYIKDLGDLQTIGGEVSLRRAAIEDLERLKLVIGDKNSKGHKVIDELIAEREKVKEMIEKRKQELLPLPHFFGEELLTRDFSEINPPLPLLGNNKPLSINEMFYPPLFFEDIRDNQQN